MKKRKATALAMAALTVLSAAGCGSSETGETAKVTVEAQNPRTGELSLETAYIGTISPEQQVYVTPLVSGTVTEVNYNVGDSVQEGAVLFRIDDDAAQLQMDSAQASYSQAKAGVDAATGGSRHLQEYQTEEGIESLEDSLDDIRDSISSMESQISSLNEQESALTTALSQAQSAVDAQSGVVSSLETALNGLKSQLEELKNSQAAAPTEAAQTETGNALENPLAEGTGTETISQSNVSNGQEEALQAQIQQKELELAEAKLLLTQLQGKRDEAQSGLAAAKSGKSQLETALETAKTQKETLKENLETAEKTYDITKNEVYPETDATYSAQLSAAAVGIKSAQMQLDNYTVTAPISGVIEAVSVEKDQLTSAGSAAYVISNKDSMTVTFQVAEQAKEGLQVGDAITVERGGDTYAGTITEVGTMAGAQTRLFQVKASVLDAGDSLPSGVSVKVHAATQKESDSLIVPYDAVYFSAGDAYVYCVEDGVLKKTPVTVGLMNDTEAAIEEGLTADSVVVTTWSARLRDGAEAEVKE